MVDVCNWCSLEFQLPYGLYDAAHIEGDVVLRLGQPGESYPGIRKDDVHVGGRITLADRTGAVRQPDVGFGANDGDAATTRALVVVFAPRDDESAVCSPPRRGLSRAHDRVRRARLTVAAELDPCRTDRLRRMEDIYRRSDGPAELQVADWAEVVHAQ